STAVSRSSKPGTSPSSESRRRPAHGRAGRSFSRPGRLRQLRRRAAQHLVLLLQQPDPLLRLAQLASLLNSHPWLDPVLDIGGLEPQVQSLFANREILGDTGQRPAVLPPAGDRNDVLAELSWIGPRHGAHPS